MKYRVHLHSKASPGRTYYDGHIDVGADDEDQAIDKALNTLKRGAFPDRSRDDWVVDKVEEG